jgi:hypothetical protein
MSKPIPYNPNLRKVKTPPRDSATQAVRVVVIPPAESTAEPAVPKGRNILNRLGRLRTAVPNRGKKQ